MRVLYNENMDEIVKASIDGRKTAVLNAYDLDADEKKKLDALFVKIEKLGLDCKDSADFEMKFAASPLNAEYMQLFTDLATSKQSKVKPVGDVQVEEVDMGKVAADTAKDAALSEVEYAAQSVKGRAARKAMSEIRDKVPLADDVVGVKNKIDFFSRFKKPKA